MGFKKSSMPGHWWENTFWRCPCFPGRGQSLLSDIQVESKTQLSKTTVQQDEMISAHGKWWSVGRAGPRTQTSPVHFYPGSSLSYRLPTVWHMSQMTWSQKTAFLQLRGWSDRFVASLDFVFHRPQYFVMLNISDVIWIHSFHSSVNHTNVRHAKVIFFEMTYQPYEHNSSHLISGIKTTFLFR